MLRAEIHGELLEDPVARVRHDGKQYTTGRAIAATFGGPEQVVNLVCFQHEDGERLRKLRAGDHIHAHGHLTLKVSAEYGRSSLGLNIRRIFSNESSNRYTD